MTDRTNQNLHDSWLALIIGNSRLHWAWFLGTDLQHTWDTSHLSETAVQQLIQTFFNFEPYGVPQFSISSLSQKTLPELWIASVVPQQTALWKHYPNGQLLTSEQITLKNAYSTLGIDRVLASRGAGKLYGNPVLVIDSGTALTFTGIDEQQQFVGGAVLPGLQTQFQGLHQATAALPAIATNTLPETIPTRWATSTIEAIQSGIIHMLLSGIRDFLEDWQRQFPASVLVLTGGDRALLHQYLQQQLPEWASRVIVDANLAFWGVRSLRDAFKSQR